MKKILLFFVCLLTYNFSYSQIFEEMENSERYTFQEIVDSTERYHDKVGREKGKGYGPFKRWQYWAQRSLDENGKIITSAQAAKAYNQFADLEETTRAITSGYTELGPMSATNTSTWSSHLGRVTSIAIDPNDADHIIVGSGTGGIWRTVDKGATWSPLSDLLPTMDTYSLEISHANAAHYFAGTNLGIRYSTDSGATWTAATGNDPSGANTLVMHPTNSNILYAASTWTNGVHKSSDGGLTWIKNYTHSGNMYDVEFKPSTPSTIYASGDGVIIKSTDDGVTFTTLSGPYNNTQNIMLAVTEADNDYLYALQQNSSGGFGGLFRSIDAGSTFTMRSDNSCDCNNIMGYDLNDAGGQAPRDMDVIVSPIDKEEVHVAGTETWVSSDGGTNWTVTTSWLVGDSEPFIHADVDILIYEGNTIYAGTDGGIFYSTDEADSFTDISQGLGVREIYRIGASETEADRVSVGSQDNGTGVHKNGAWFDFVGADGMETCIDNTNSNIIYATIQFGGLYKSTNGGTSLTSITNTPGSGAWVTPLEHDQNNANTLLQGKKEVYKTTNGGSSWTAISSIGNGSKNLNEITMSPSNSDVIYASFSDELYMTSDGGTNWTDVTPTNSFSNINYISIHPTDETRVCLVMSGASTVLLESTDSGVTWLDIESNLPNLSANCVTYEGDVDDGMYIGMDPGIYYKSNTSGGNWSNVTDDLPLVRVSELEIRNNVMYVGTYGRGLWKVSLGDALGNYICDNATNITGTCSTTYTAVAPDQGSGAIGDGNATNSVWYKYTPTATGVIGINSCGSSVDTRLWVYSGSCSNLTLIANDDNTCDIISSSVENVPVTAGVPIYIEWDDQWSQDAFDFTINTGNYFCEDYINITAAGTFTAPTLACGGATNTNASDAVWYRFVPPFTGLIDVYSCGGGVDTRLWMYTGDCTSLTALANNDDACEMSAGSDLWATQILGVSVTSGVPVYLEWDNRWSNDGFDWVIDYQSTPCPQDFAGTNQLTGNLIVNSDFETDGIIESNQIIDANANVDYDSGTRIDLFEDFEIKSGVLFNAFIDGCGNALKPDDQPLKENKD